MLTVVRIHATNINGVGAIQLFNSLFPHLVQLAEVQRAYISPQITTATYRGIKSQGTRVFQIKRRFPKAVSRALECLVFTQKFGGEGAILVMGDIPLRRVSRQVVLVHSPHIVSSATFLRISEWKYVVARALFRLNARYVAAFIVQSQVMRDELVASFPSVSGRVHVIPQPPPEWVLEEGPFRAKKKSDGKLRLFYPSAAYPHKNHAILRELDVHGSLGGVIEKIVLTLPIDSTNNLKNAYIECVGPLNELEMVRQYRISDALLFLSLKETFGFPLVEAMWLNLPIICPDLPYARWMCGKEAIYFDPESSESLKSAIIRLHMKLMAGWQPNWSEQLDKIPSSWNECAGNFVRLCEAAETDLHAETSNDYS